MKHLLLLTLALTTIVFARPTVIATGGPTGNYFSMSQEIIDPEVCGGIADYELLNTEGSSDNIYLATQKKAKIFWSSMDVLLDEARLNPAVNQNNYKLIARMHDEPVHLLFPKNWKPVVESSWMDKLSNMTDSLTGNSPAPVTIDINLLKGQVIGSWGGSVKAAEALSNVFQLNATIKVVPSTHRTNPGIPTLLVGGAPYGPVQEMLATGKYILVSLDHTNISRVAPHYQSATVTYKMDGKVKSIPTVAVPALLLGKSSRRAKKNLPMEQLATCINNNLEDLEEDSNNPNWTSVYEANNGGNQLNWQSFDLIEPK